MVVVHQDKEIMVVVLQAVQIMAQEAVVALEVQEEVLDLLMFLVQVEQV